MADTTRTVRVRFDGDSRGMQGAARQGGDAVQSFSDKLAGFAAKGFFIVEGATAVAESIGAIGGAVLAQAGKLEAIEQKSATVFGNSLGTIQTWADEVNENFGLTAKQVTGLAADMGDLLIPMGFTRETAAAMSKDMIGLAAAMSEFEGGSVSTAEVSRILTNALLGEREELKSLGVSISQADIDARILKKGQQELTGAQLQQAEATATQELIFEKSADAQTAYAAGGNEVVRSQNNIKAALAESREAFVEGLIPAIESTLGFVRNMLATMKEMGVIFSSLPGPVKIGVGALAGLAVAVPLVKAAGEKISSGIQGVRDSLANMTRAGRITALSLGGLGLALTIAAGVLAVFAGRQAQAKASGESFRDSLDETTGAITKQTREWAVAELRFESFNGLAQSAADGAENLGISLKDLTTASLHPASDASKELTARLREISKGADEGKEGFDIINGSFFETEDTANHLLAVLDDMHGRVKENKEVWEENKGAVEGATGAKKEQNEATAEATQKAQEESAAIQEVIDKLTALTETHLAAENAEIAQIQAYDKLTETVKENGPTLDRSTEQGIENEQALNAVVSATNRRIDAAAKDGESQERLQEIKERGIVKLYDEMEALGFTREEIDRYIQSIFDVPGHKITELITEKEQAERRIRELRDKLKQVPPEKRTKIEAKIEQAKRRLGIIQGRIDNVHGKDVVVRVRGNLTELYNQLSEVNAGPLRDFRAAGGPVDRGAPYVVGERGWEVFIPQQNGRILSHQESQRLVDSSGTGAGGGDGPLIVENHIEIGGEVVRVVRTQIDRQQRGLKRRASARVVAA